MHKLLRAVVVLIPLEVEHVAFKLFLDFLFGVDALLLFCLLELIAHPLVASMGFPLHHAQPAELVPTPTLHSVAALVLFDGLLARGTDLSVGCNPLCVLLFTLVLQLPRLKQHAGQWLMAFLPTLHA